ncbi:MAG: MFS transporter, partial [Pseudomonadota bacterium]
MPLYALIGVGVGASGTSLLALLATAVAPERRPAAASITWIMMIVGIVLTAAIAGANLDPFTPQRLALVATVVAGVAFVLTLLAVSGVEDRLLRDAPPPSLAQDRGSEARVRLTFREVIEQIWAEPLARGFTIFVFASMLAYSAQDLILEPYAGLVFGYSVGESTALAGVQHGGVLLGMILVGLSGAILRGDRALWLKRGTIFGCAASAGALVLLASAGFNAGGWPLAPTVFALGFANGVFAVSAIGLMMSFAGAGAGGREGVRMGLWGASQAIAFGLGGFAGAVGLDTMRGLAPTTEVAFASVFGAEAAVFLVAAWLA